MNKVINIFKAILAALISTGVFLTAEIILTQFAIVFSFVVGEALTEILKFFKFVNE